MKKNFKNTSIFNYQYLDTLVEYLNKEKVDQESKIALLRRLLAALAATEQGERHEYYIELKKNLTEHKSLEHIIELLVKKDFPALQAMPFDYSKGIFEVFRVHKDAVKLAVISILERELSLFVTSALPSIEEFKTQDLFDHYTIILNNLLEIRQLEIEQLEPLISQSCEHALAHVSTLCDQLKVAFSTPNTITDSQYAMRISYMLDLHQAILADVWGSLRLSFLRLSARKQAIELLKAQKLAENKETIAHEHSASCTCKEHQE
jgi:hypothetical protein